MKNWLLLLSLILVITGIIGLIVINAYFFSPFGSRRSGFRKGPGLISRDYSTNGEQIYFEGVSRNRSVSFSGGPIWFRMHDGGCVTCHGADGRGGRVTTMMGSFTAHDIRFSSLRKEKPPFTVSLIKRAITKGIDNEGKRVDSNMPRWSLQDSDLTSVVNYLKTL